MEESIDVTGIPEPDPMLGCGVILSAIGIIATISILGYLLFKIDMILIILLYCILSVVIGVTIIVLCFKADHYGKL